MKFVLNLNADKIAVSKSMNFLDVVFENEIEITEEQYNEINEFPLQLTLNESGKVVSWEKTEITPDPAESERQLMLLKSEKIPETKQQLSEFLEGHPLQYNGEYYSVTQEKQALLTSAIAAYQLRVQAGAPATLKWNTTGDVCREFTLQEITGLVIAITDYVQPRVELQQELEIQIKNCITQEDLESIIINYNEV